MNFAVPMEYTARHLHNYANQHPNTCLQPNCGITLDGITARLKDIALNYLNYFKPPQSNLTKEEFNALRNLQKNKNIIIIRPDKGNGIVILDRLNYVEKLNNILSDNTKFINIPFNNLFKLMLSFEDNSRKKLKNCSSKIFKETAPTGSQLRRLYGVPKVHKTGGPLRPILSSMNTPNYLLAKYLVPHLQILTENEFTVEDTFSFVKEITNQDRQKDGIMVSFDVESLFTNVPLDETINIIFYIC
ncbi:uncharacterized protein LOC126886076 [Diabrotica virgifera virgifera]|uniref:Reverse transcriptase domain-containing protein n=1 Tax=Diabrotica virgifera virgifera TaxID=50390 RepID=A0ABM5KFA0_DIAVI|nr:uncharacterized protein LOC126886076 [Diabrotica virgifera virgifera]